jgi:DNA-binding MarR family transcriptional regulator
LRRPDLISASAREEHSRRILASFESDHGISQRSLSRELGIALGLTNLLVKRLVRKGWVRIVQIKPNRVKYLITPAGIAEKARMSRAYLESSVEYYKDARDRVQEQFASLSIGRSARIVFYGAGEVAEIGYICLGETDLHLVGVVDGARTKPFFGLNICTPGQLDGLVLDGQPFDYLAVMSFGNTETLRDEIQALGVPLDRVFWL